MAAITLAEINYGGAKWSAQMEKNGILIFGQWREIDPHSIAKLAKSGTDWPISMGHFGGQIPLADSALMIRYFGCDFLMANRKLEYLENSCKAQRNRISN